MNGTASIGLIVAAVGLKMPAIFIAVLAFSRVPGLMPGNFSVVYAFVFCAGIFFSRNLVWWLPLAAMLLLAVTWAAAFDPREQRWTIAEMRGGK